MPNPPDTPAADRPFTVRLKQSAKELIVAPGTSILEALESAGIDHPFGCREGLCRSCETEVCAGEPDHRDYVLSDAERATGRTMMVCVSRSKGDHLELDL